jgi:hypothetical protein
VAVARYSVVAMQWPQTPPGPSPSWNRHGVMVRVDHDDMIIMIMSD